MTARDRAIFDAIEACTTRVNKQGEHVDVLAKSILTMGEVITELAARVEGLETTFAEVAAQARRDIMS